MIENDPLNQANTHICVTIWFISQHKAKHFLETTSSSIGLTIFLQDALLWRGICVKIITFLPWKLELIYLLYKQNYIRTIST